MAPTRVILMSCGSYNPPTNMHLRMFEIARDHLHRMGTHIVVGGVISPTHDDYAKKELASSEHRCAMLKLATQNSDWIKISTWESRQNGWTKTRLSLQHHQNLLNSVLLDTNDIKHHTESGETDWIPQNVKNSTDRTPIQIKLLCGADLLESFGTPGLWADEDIDAIVGQHGLVVITREGSNPNKFIYDSDILSKYMHNIHIVTEWIPNEVSSTKIRRALKRGESVRYLVQDSVIEYIYKHGIYDAKTDSTIKLELSSKNDNDYLSIQPKYESTFLTPSPSDVTMTTPSPIEIISIDISESVLKKNYHNTPINSLTNLTKLSEDNDRIREKFNSVISDNVNKILGSNKVAYPGQAKQIIANESGESQIFCEVGLSCISENYKVEMEIDGKVGRVIETDNYPVVPSCSKDMKAIEDRINISNDEIPSESIEPLKTSDQTLTPDDSESKISVILSIDVIDASNVRIREECVKHESPTSSIIQETLIDESLKDSKENVAIEMPEENCHEKSTVALKSEEEKSSLIEDDERSIKIIESESILKTVIHPECSKLQKDEPDVSLIERNVPSTDDVSNSMEKSITGTNERDPSDQDSTTEESIPKREGNIEIDGKYLKSVVNSRKSPKKVKNEVIRSVSSDGSKYSEIKMEKETSSQMEIEESPNSIASMETKDGAMKIVETAGRKRGVVFQGSLDSINVKQPKSLQLNNQDNPSISKKSKSYEFIKPNELQPTKIYKIPLSSLKDGNGTSSCDEASKIKTDSNSIFTTANESQEGGQTDEFCSVCCYANEPESTEAFYTLRSTGSSPLEEALTECDICSNCDLREDPIEEKKTFKQVGPGEPVCELCEICGDAAMDEDVVASSRPEKDDFVDRRLLASRPLPLSLPKRKKGVVGLNARTFSNIDNDDEEDEDEDDVDHFEMDANAATRKITESRDKLHILRANTSEQHSTDDTSSNDDEFEIENCGLDPDLDLDNGNEQNSRYKNEVEDTLRNIVPRDEIALSAKNSKKMTRAGSLISRDNIDRTKGKRRYASVDNLQNSRQIVKTSTTEKPNSLRSRGTGKSLVASADNIRPVRNSRSRTTLRKSADDVGRDSIDDTRESPLYENITRKKFPPKEQQAHKPRDSGTIKMILTKHGIKIISDKETAL